MTTPVPRPRIVDAAFWTWLVAAVLLVVSGLSALTIGADQLRKFFTLADDQVSSLLSLNRGIGVLCVVAGLAMGWLAGKVRTGERRFRRASIALSAVTAVILAGVARLVPTVALPLALVALVFGLIFICLPKARSWFSEVERTADG
ncbi:MAG: hypothetical protein ACSLE6_19890 [Mycobacterium sp.]